MKFILQLGNDQLTPKATYYPDALKSYGFETVYLSEDRSGLSSATIANQNLIAEIASKYWLVRYIQFFTMLYRYKPVAIELYLSQRPWFILFYFAVGKLFKKNIVVWCRGELRNFRKHHWLRRFTNRIVLKYSDRVLLRETYMKDILTSEGLYDSQRMSFFHNCISLTKPLVDVSQNSQIVFLNSFKRFRNIELIIQAAKILKDDNYSFEIKLVGSTLENDGYSPSSEEYEIFLRKLVTEYGLSEMVKFLPFSDSVVQHLESARMFVLPADIVFCNYTLLESMSMCIPPIVTNIPESKLIIEDKVDGLLVDRSASALAEAMKNLLDSSELAVALGKCARKKVFERFNIDNKAKELASFYGS